MWVVVNETNPLNVSTGLVAGASTNVSRDSSLDQDSITARLFAINQLRTEIQQAGVNLTASTGGTLAQTAGASFGTSNTGVINLPNSSNFAASTSGSLAAQTVSSNFGSSTYLGGPQLGVSNNERPRYNPGLHLPGFERNDPGTRIDYGNGSYLISELNDDGLLEETLVGSDNSRTITTYEDLPGDKNSTLPKGFRATILKQNASGTITDSQTISVIYNKLDDDRFTATAIDLSDPDSPQHLYSSVVTKTDMEDAAGNSLYDTNTSFADGSKQRVENSFVNSSVDLSAYGQTITNSSSNGASSSTKLQFITQKDSKGFNKMSIMNVNNPSSPQQIASSTSPDTSMLRTRNLGSEMSPYLDAISEAGLLDVTGDGQVSPYTDLILISRYNQGLRGAALIANINFGSSSPNLSSIESRLGEAFSRGVYDIDGSESSAKISAQANGENLNVEISDNDINFIARYMFGARDGAIADPRSADDTSIPINEDASNLLLVNANDPLLLDYQQIFIANGVNFTASGQDLIMFYVSQEDRSEGNTQNTNIGSLGASTPNLRPVNRIILPRDLAPEGSTHG